MKKMLLTVVALLIMTTFCNNILHARHLDNPAKALVLHSYSQDYDWASSVEKGIESILKADRDKYELRVEYMDTNHIKGEEYIQHLRNIYRYKFADQNFDVIIVADNAAFDFLRVYRDELFPGVPVVFCGINGFEYAMLDNVANFTGVAEDNDFAGCFQVALKLQPNTKLIVDYGISGDPTHEANAANIRKSAAEIPREVRVQIRELSSIEKVIEDANKLPPDSIVFMDGNMVLDSGLGVNLQRAYELISDAVNVPVYTAWDFGIGHGAVGGLVISGFEQGRLAAEMAVMVLNGEKPSDIPVLRGVANRYMFDYNQMKRHNISPDKIPTDSIVINLPESEYKIDRNLFWAGGVFTTLLAISVILLIVNIQRRKSAEQLLAASEEKFSKAFRYCADVIGIARLQDEVYIEINEAFVNTFGYTQQEVIGHTSNEFCLWVDLEVRDRLFSELATVESLYNLEARWRTKSGQVRVGLYSAEVIEISGERCILYVWHDITERKQAEEELRKANEELEYKVEVRTQELTALNEEIAASNLELQETNTSLENEVNERRKIEERLASANSELTKAVSELKAMQGYLVQSEKMAALGSLVAGVAHEVNTPVGVGVTAASHLHKITKEFLDLCINGSPRRKDMTHYLGDLEESTAIILANLERAAQLIKSFKQLSVDQSSEARRVFNIKTYFDEIILSMQPKLKKTKHQITIQCDDDLKLDSFPGAFSQIVTNLIVNSLVHAYEPSDNGHIQIGATIKGDYFEMNYSDDGKGILPADRARMFDPFFTTKRGSGGTGLGLYVLYNIITQQFGGTVECDSEIGRGTTFLIKFPIAKG